MSFRDLFDELDDRGVVYVVPRKYDRLPEEPVDDDGDVDVVVHPEQFEVSVAVCEAVGFDGNDGGGRVELLRAAVRNPRVAIEQVVRAPTVAAGMAVSGERRHRENPRHRNVKRYRGEEMVDLRDGLAYVSPMDGSRIPVDPAVTRGMLDRRRRRDCYYVPAPADELAHVVPHCVYDKDGEFSPYYADRCRFLFERVRSDPERRERFERLLELVFFEAADLVFELVAEERYAELRPALKRFADY